MFRRLANRVTSAVSGTASEDEKVQTLKQMGFDDDSLVRNALQATNGSVDRAAELLLSYHAGDAAIIVAREEALQNAMEESLQSEENRAFRLAQEASVASAHQRARSAAVTRAGQAAARRAEAATALNLGNSSSRIKPQTGAKPRKAVALNPNPAPSLPRQEPVEILTPSKVVKPQKVLVSHHHPQVTVPAKLQDKTKEEQVLRSADRLKPYPLAVDTIYRVLTTIQKDPSNDKYRKVDKTTAGYKRSLEGVPGAEALLLAMNFHTRGAYTLILERPFVDQALLYLGISALEEAKLSHEYIEAKKALTFAKAIKEIQLESNMSEAEAVRRAEFITKCPSEPAGGRGALMQVKIADATIRRRFDGDDVLRDVINWIGGSYGSVIPEMILSREWCIIDVNRYPIAPIDCERNLEKTLQYIGCWPSGRLEIRPSSESWRNYGVSSVAMGSARGLGAAPTAFLH